MSINDNPAYNKLTLPPLQFYEGIFLTYIKLMWESQTRYLLSLKVKIMEWLENLI